MTECERIIKDGLLPDSFFNQEKICDYVVSNNMKKNWAVCIDLLVYLDSICRKNNINYFVAYGSLLGIIRHGGFIPWDDDIDVCMLREDYEKLLRIKDSIPHPYFLQIPGSDNDYYYSYAKLRNSNTSAVSYPFRYASFNQGIGLDIFILDNCLTEYAEKIHSEMNELIMENSANMRRSNPYKSEIDMERCRRYPQSDPVEVLNRMEFLAKQFNGTPTDQVFCAMLTTYSSKKLIYDRKDIEDLMETDFYGHKVMIPVNYDKILKTTYGDYMVFPPIEERGLWHNNEIISADIPYTDTIKALLDDDKRQFYTTK